MLKALIDAYRRNVVYRTTYNELASLSNRELYDLGMTRGCIKDAAYEATYGKEAF